MREYLYCPRCGQGFFPLDPELELLPGQYTPQVYGWIARLSGWMPFAAAAQMATALLRVAVSKSSAVRTAEAAGAAYVAMQTEQAAELARRARRAPVGAARMVVSADGAMVPLVHGEWGEVRTLAIGTVVKCCPCRRENCRRRSTRPPAGQPANQGSTAAAVGPDRTPAPSVTTPHASVAGTTPGTMPKQSAGVGGKQPQAAEVRTVDISYFSRFTSAERFTHLALAETHHRGLENAGEVAAVMDGADWLQQLTDYHCPKAVRILDFAHAAQHIAAVAQALWGQNNAETVTWSRQWIDSLLAQGPRPLLAELRPLQKLHPDNEALGANFAYLKTRQAQMDYPRFRHQGRPIGKARFRQTKKKIDTHPRVGILVGRHGLRPRRSAEAAACPTTTSRLSSSSYSPNAELCPGLKSGDVVSAPSIALHFSWPLKRPNVCPTVESSSAHEPHACAGQRTADENREGRNVSKAHRSPVMQDPVQALPADPPQPAVNASPSKLPKPWDRALASLHSGTAASASTCASSLAGQSRSATETAPRSRAGPSKRRSAARVQAPIGTRLRGGRAGRPCGYSLCSCRRVGCGLHCVSCSGDCHPPAASGWRWWSLLRCWWSS